MKRIGLLGSTGSIGHQTLDIAAAHKDELTVTALAAGGRHLDILAQQIKEFSPKLVSVPNEHAAQKLKDLLNGDRPDIVYGAEGLEAVATHSDVEMVVTGVVGFLGVKPTAAAIKAGKTIALANKETLVAAGAAIMPMAREYGAKIIPVDSEHSAIFQSLHGYGAADIEQILLTGSGGPFRTWTLAQMEDAHISDALNHPNWSMGKKITIDSATLMNKGLEIIEARWLFDVPPEKIKVLIHPQSILHSAVQFVDGSVVGQLGLPDMRLPIHYSLFYPHRASSERVPRLDLVKLGQMTFEEPDLKRFPCLRLAKEVATREDTTACVLNAANEIVVEAFLDGAIKFLAIAANIEMVLERHKPITHPTLEDILEADRWARQEAKSVLNLAAGKL